MEEFLNIMVPDSDSPHLPISTLVFMDLEATGLPSFVGKRNVHITEISLIAIDRTEFEADSSLRVLNKLSLCIRPRTFISPGASSITGLYNDTLEKQEKFDETIPKLLEYFFRRLRRPMCLLAHNGNRYDFPLLQAELQNINYTLDPAILCADTLEAFRYLVPGKIKCPFYAFPSHEKQINQKNITKDQSNLTFIENTSDEKHESVDQETEDLLSQDIHLFRDIIETDCTIPTTSNKADGHQMDDRTPPKTCSASISFNPHKKKKIDPNWLPKNQYQHENKTAKRQLFKNDRTPKIQYSLEKLYGYFFNEDPPKSHYAEADCVSLSKVCQKINEEFLEWLDRNSKPFSDVKAMW